MVAPPAGVELPGVVEGLGGVFVSVLHIVRSFSHTQDVFDYG